LELRDSATLKIGRAADEANQYFDNVLSEKTENEVITLNLDLSGQEISSPEDVDRIVNDLRERLLAQLEGKPNIRIRLK
jgi:hypothetical protein